MTLLYEWLKIAADTRGNNKALVYRDNYLSWRGLLHRVDRRAQEFKAMGLGKDAWVGLMLGNVPDFVILALALSRLKATIVPIDPTTGARELELIMAAAPLRALVTRPRGSEATAGAPGAPGTGNGSATSSRPITIPPPIRDAEQAEGEAPEIRRRLQGTLLTCSVYKRDNPDFGTKPLSVMFTADSLGDPKGVLRTHDNHVASTASVVKALGIDTESRVLVAVPLYHAYGWDLGLLPVLQTGATIFLEEEISARRVAKLLRDHTIDVLPGTPTMYGELSKLPTAKPLTVENPRFISGGSRLDEAVADAIVEKYGVRLMSCYHTTETGVVALEMTTKAPKTVGKALDEVELEIRKPDGGKLTGGKGGGIWVRSKALSPRSIGPYKDVEASRAKSKAPIGIGEIDREGWFRTGDVGKYDRSSRLELTGREDDVVKIDGKRVALGEVEGCLEQFPKVKAAQARLVTDPFNGSMVVATVVATSKCAPEEIIDHCARNLAPYKVPRRIEFSDTDLK